MAYSENVSKLTLALLVARVLAENADNVLAFHDLARFTQSFYRCSNFHILCCFSKRFLLNFWAGFRAGLFEGRIWGQKNASGKPTLPESDFQILVTFAGRLFALWTSRKGTFLAELYRLARPE